jgi:hypothetical protein
MNFAFYIVVLFIISNEKVRVLVALNVKLAVGSACVVIVICRTTNRQNNLSIGWGKEFLIQE